MPKGTATGGKTAKGSEAEKKEEKKSVQKTKKDTSYSKFVKGAAKASGTGEGKGEKGSVAKAEGEKQIKKAPLKKLVSKRGKSAEGSKGESLIGKSPSHKTKISSVKKVGKSGIKKEKGSLAPQGKSTSVEKKVASSSSIIGEEATDKKSDSRKASETPLKKSLRGVGKKGGESNLKLRGPHTKSVSKGKAKERSRSKSIKKEKEEKEAKKGEEQLQPGTTPSKTEEEEEKGKSTPSKKSSSGKSLSSSRSPRYKEIRGGGKIPEFPGPSPSKKNRQASKAKASQSTTQAKAAQSSSQSREKISSRQIKESSSNIESSSSIDLSNEQKKNAGKYAFRPESQRISQEVQEVIKKIETKKKRQKESELISKKRKRGESTALVEANTAKDYDYILQKNPNNKKKPYVNLEELSKHQMITYSDVLLALLEVAQNSNAYLFAYSSKSRCFWSDIIQYKVLKKIFNDFKAETLRKYWTELSKYDSEETTDLIKKNKAYLDKLPLKLGTIVSSISKLLSGKIKDLKEYIDNIQIDIRKREIFEHEYKNPKTGETTKVKEVRTTYNTRKRYEPGNKKDFKGSSFNVLSLKEVYHQGSNLNDFQKVMKNLKSEELVKFNYLTEVTDDEKKKLNTINEDDKFVFKAVDNVVEGLSHEFKNYTQEYILDMLQQNSMDISKTYSCLKEPLKSKAICFTPIDDKVVLKKEGEEYKILVKEKGKEAISEREDYLNH